MNKKIYRYESNPIVAVDWEREYGLMCMDTDTFVFIPSTDMFDNVVVIYAGEDEYDIAIADEAYEEYLKDGMKSKPIEELWEGSD